MKSIWLNTIGSRVQDHTQAEKETLSILEQLDSARQEWINAQNYYDNVLDKDLIDHAAYLLKAAERKYIYLLKVAKEKGIRQHPF
ncbi:MAG TPA: YaaL family protein [Methylomusa anaerophila]|uniref:DUF2508 domain-containing protein n=1 Tax=Methylomusa anaerophila TaxID=1930071 RepID=A0A348AIF2_9FIRM|nr:YaaL family protein [Methylomusa anaerophila]BBB90850.1 hypothetical protein MAMMFC1_01514 [Methylomusa anaerophila]HML90644.1 YaaL family protein [Methylomusa anaerophila]